MTLVYDPTVIEIKNGHTKQLSQQEIAHVSRDVTQMFGEGALTPKMFQDRLDIYCQRKGISPLLVVDILL